MSMLLAVALAAGAPAAALALRPCRVPGVEEPLRCGELLVPENPAQPEGRRIALNIVVIPALKPVPGEAPLFDLAGGPGLAASEGAAFYVQFAAAHRQGRDVVLVDQRGTGRSSPLRCPELELAGALEPMYPLDAVRRCRRTLARHADLSQYHTMNSVADLDAVRAALGHERIDLVGVSYGTRLAQAYIGKHPQRVRAAVLFGAVPADATMPLWHARFAQDTLDQLIGDCAQDADCARSYPQLRQQWDRVLASSAFDGPAREAFRTLLLAPEGQRGVPSLIAAMADGDLAAFRSRFGDSDGSIADGLYLSLACAEDTHAIGASERLSATKETFLGTYRIDQQVAACKEWDVPPVALTYGSARHDVPLLAIVGDRDYVTPVAWARKVVAGSSAGRLVVIPKMGHMPMGMTGAECLDAILLDFFARPGAAELDTACIDTMHPPPFVVPADPASATDTL